MLTKLFLKMAFGGGEWVLWILLICSFVNVAIIVDRWLYFRKNRVDGERLGAQLDELMRQGDLRGAWQLVYEQEAIECVVVAAGLNALRRGIHACGEAMAGAKARMRMQLDARLAILGTIGSNAAFIGLLGTVLGIIKAAHDLTAETGSGQADPNAVMSGVFEALIATAVGLGVAIPAVVAFNIFQRKVRATLSQVDSLAHQVLGYAQHETRGSSQSHQQPAKV